MLGGQFEPMKNAFRISMRFTVRVYAMNESRNDGIADRVGGCSVRDVCLHCSFIPYTTGSFALVSIMEDASTSPLHKVECIRNILYICTSYHAGTHL